jgi:hypothetical protein
MDNIADLRKRQVAASKKTLDILRNVLRGVTPAQARTLRDGAAGWTVLEVVCHLRDFNDLFHQRVRMMRDQDYPALPAVDHEALARQQHYNAGDLPTALTALADSRRALINTFKALTLEQWERSGLHPERGLFTLTDAALQVVTHDCDHIEQITRILTQR